MQLPNEATLKELVRRYAELLTSFGAEIGKRPLVLPTGEYFPDHFARDAASVRALVRRMQAHAGMSDIPIVARLLGTEAPAGNGSCGTGGCSQGACAVPEAPGGALPRLVDDGEKWHINIPEAELAAPVVLTTLTSRSLAHVFLVETAHESAPIPDPVDVTADLTAVLLGFGPLMLEGAYMYSKSCGGPSVNQSTRLTLPELAVATALFCLVGGHRARPLLKELGTTQRALFAEALDWSKANDRIVRLLKTDPAALSMGDIQFEEAQPWLLRVLRSRKTATNALSLSELEALAASLAPNHAKQASARTRDSRRDDGLKDLVTEALTAARTDAE